MSNKTEYKGTHIVDTAMRVNNKFDFRIHHMGMAVSLMGVHIGWIDGGLLPSSSEFNRMDKHQKIQWINLDAETIRDCRDGMNDVLTLFPSQNLLETEFPDYRRNIIKLGLENPIELAHFHQYRWHVWPGSAPSHDANGWQDYEDRYQSCACIRIYCHNHTEVIKLLNRAQFDIDQRYCEADLKGFLPDNN